MTITRRAVDGIRFLDPPTGNVFAKDLTDIKDLRRDFKDWEERGARARFKGLGYPGRGALLNPFAASNNSSTESARITPHCERRASVAMSTSARAPV